MQSFVKLLKPQNFPKYHNFAPAPAEDVSSTCASYVRAILDTSMLIATEVPQLDGELAISAASLAELHFGVLVTVDGATRAERLRRLTFLQRSLPWIDQHLGLGGGAAGEVGQGVGEPVE